ncbi:MAG: hypothetical protein H6635_07485 [Anaerolineales bacterium]|nr:hypothetical protein [Anaerolineales bacterium]MCB9145193.1 hypothetical protein [Anaerolineales bacterium]
MENSKVAKPIWHIVSVVLGGLSIWPYPIVWAANAFQPESLPSFLGAVLGIVLFFIAPCNGVPFGLAGMIAGMVGVVRSKPISKRNLVVGLALFGILVSIAGCASNIYFFSNMVPWNSLPQE